MTETEKYLKELADLNIIKAVFSNKTPDGKYKKAVIRTTSNGMFQAELFTEKQAFHENFPCDLLYKKMSELFNVQFKQAEFFTENYIYSAKISKKGTLLHSRRKNDTFIKTSSSHDRKKNYIIDSENLPGVFYELGISASDGKIISSKYDKFKQICRFIEQINDVLAKEQKETLEIIDFGCGKSYLTFVLYFYITEILHKNAHITGLDLKEDVIEKCKNLAKKYNYSGLDFLCMDIKDFKPKTDVDMVITLHACDTATDYALYFAVNCNAKYIFSVPCCQKEARKQIHTDNFSLITDYGILNDRFCSIVTDALRGKILEYYGYSVDVCEFIDFENSPKNVLIRAKRKPSADRFKKEKIKKQIERIKSEFGITITLERLFEE